MNHAAQWKKDHPERVREQARQDMARTRARKRDFQTAVVSAIEELSNAALTRNASTNE